MDGEEISFNLDWKIDPTEPILGDMIKHVYGGGETQPVGPHGHLLLDSLSLENLDDYIERELKKVLASLEPLPEDRGILGPDRVIFDVTSNVGSLVIDRDRLGLSSRSNFTSIRANSCVYKGKWQYELMLNSKGVMQVGWATLNCKFSQEKGVGDTQDSYAYDGNRVRKWNVSTYKYGEPWLMNDVIGVTIDLDDGIVSFYRNGKFLGKAFENVHMGPGMAYFPAVSLAYNENLLANFGATPMHYPVPGFHSLQQLPKEEVLKTEKLLSWLTKLLHLYRTVNKEQSDSNKVVLVKNWPPKCRDYRKTEILLLAAPLFHRLGPLLTSAYVTEACLLPFLFKLSESEDSGSNSDSKVSLLLNLMWALLEPQELQLCLEYLVFALFIGYRCSPVTTNYRQPKRFLLLTLLIVQHKRTRHYLLKNVLFDKIKFPIILEVKPLDNEALHQLLPDMWLDLGQECTPDETILKKMYENSCFQLKATVEEVELIQLEILTELFNGFDIHQGQASRDIFLSKFWDFLRENSGGTRATLVHLCPSSVALAFFHRLIELLKFYCSLYKFDENKMLCVPAYIFSSNSDDCLEIQRIGGLQSYLLKTFHNKFDLYLTEEDMNGKSTTSGNKDIDIGYEHFTKNTGSSNQSLKGSAKDFKAMVELVDGIIRLYHIAAHRHLEKMCTLRDSMQEYTTALQDIEKRLVEQNDCTRELLLAKKVFLNKLMDQGRHYAWISSVVYSTERRSDVYWLWRILLRSLSHTSEIGEAFSFVPDFYVEACIKCANALRTFFQPLSEIDVPPDYQETLIQYGKFLACHFADSRVVNTELKDSLVQALASYVCYPSTLQALENIDEQSRIVMTKSLLQTYENRAWAQTNWILIRLWKGCGFAFRYSVPPHLSKRSAFKAANLTDSMSSYHQKPCPSPVFLKHIYKWLVDNPEASSAFLSSILNQLNWAFSEFVGMLQEIQNASNKPERVFIDSRELKICATCFDLTLGLLRVLEMTAHLVPQLYTDWTKPSAEVFLTRLCQLLCQVLNRVTSRSGCFCLVVSMEIAGLEVVDHFPILSAVTGILVSLILDGEQQSRDRAISVLLCEPSFQPSSLNFLLGSTTDAKTGKCFSFRDYEEVSITELEQVETLTFLLHAKYKISQLNRQSIDINDEAVCTICYASAKCAMFIPCQHQSCRSCISLHLLQHQECFFCKTVIDRVQLETGEVIYPTSTTTTTTSQ